MYLVAPTPLAGDLLAARYPGVVVVPWSAAPPVGDALVVVVVDDEPARIRPWMDVLSRVFDPTRPVTDLDDLVAHCSTHLGAPLKRDAHTHRMLRRCDVRPAPAVWRSLTPAEAWVLLDLCDGRTPVQIADAHGVSLTTVRTQTGAIRRKLGVSSTLEAVALAWATGWLRTT
jgi:DNA-binding CsgD family transcriptional regulator